MSLSAPLLFFDSVPSTLRNYCNISCGSLWWKAACQENSFKRDSLHEHKVHNLAQMFCYQIRHYDENIPLPTPMFVCLSPLACVCLIFIISNLIWGRCSEIDIEIKMENAAGICVCKHVCKRVDRIKTVLTEKHLQSMRCEVWTFINYLSLKFIIGFYFILLF